MFCYLVDCVLISECFSQFSMYIFVHFHKFLFLFATNWIPQSCLVTSEKQTRKIVKTQNLSWEKCVAVFFLLVTWPTHFLAENNFNITTFLKLFIVFFLIQSIWCVKIYILRTIQIKYIFKYLCKCLLSRSRFSHASLNC